MSTIRQELLQSAVKFLKDSQVKSKPLQKRIAFLEYKGLTSDEIEEALIIANDEDITSDVQEVFLSQPNKTSVSEQITYTQSSIPRIDWKDYVIAAALVGGIGYVIASIAKNYIVSFLGALTSDDLEHEKQLFSDQFTTTTASLDVLKFDTQIIKKSLKEQSFEVNKILEILDNVLRDLKYYEERKDIELGNLKEDMDSIRDLIPKLLEESEDSQEQLLTSLQQELKLLKSLVILRALPTQTNSSQIVETLASSLSINTNMSTNSGAISNRSSIP
ncbi:5370_t:CDS:2, partial [Cetraspora pellucida]